MIVSQRAWTTRSTREPAGSRRCVDDSGRVIALRRWAKVRVRPDLSTSEVALLVGLVETRLADSVSPFFWFRGF